MIVEKVFDPTMVDQEKRANSRVVQTTKGEIYQKIFLSSLPHCEKILDFATLKESISMEKIGQLVQRLLVDVKNRKELRKKYGAVLVRNTIRIWRQLSLNCSPSIVAGLITGMASLNYHECRDSVELSDWWCGMMMDVNAVSLKEKSEFIHFFGLFGLSKRAEIVKKVM